MSDFNTHLADILDVEEVKEGDILADFPSWDSLSILSVIALLDSKYGVNVDSSALKSIKFVGELWRLAQKN